MITETVGGEPTSSREAASTCGGALDSASRGIGAQATRGNDGMAMPVLRRFDLTPEGAAARNCPDE
jgi:hypothetical protein